MTWSPQSGHGINGTKTERPHSPDQTELEDDMRREGGDNGYGGGERAPATTEFGAMAESEGEGKGKVSGVGSIQTSAVRSSAASTQAGRQEVAGARGRAHGAHARRPSVARKTTGGRPVGWAGPGR